MRFAALLLLLAACPKPAPPVQTDAVPDDVPRIRRDGPKAGPHYVVDEPLPPPPDPEVPGQGPLVPYLSSVRKAIMANLGTCLAANPASPAKSPVLVAGVIDPEGRLVDVALRRSSQSSGLDACVVQAFRQAELGPPPPEAIGPEGTLLTPDMAFVPVVSPLPAP